MKTIRLGIISDTHIPGRARKLPRALTEGLQGTDVILHAGDWVSEEAVDMLEQIAPVEGVAGNNDPNSLVKRFRYKKIREFGNRKIGIVHGHDARMSPEQKALETFRDDDVDVIVFGHSHVPVQKQAGSVLLLNPGSPTDKRFQPEYSYIILELTENDISVRFQYYRDKS